MPWYKNRYGEQLWYEERGEGWPVVLLHGWCISSAVWHYQLTALHDSIRVIAPDLRGHGCSREVCCELNFDRFANDIADLFEALNLKQAVLTGWSMGAQIAMKVYRQLSERLYGMALVSATPCFTATHDFSHALAYNETRGMRLRLMRNSRQTVNSFYSRIFAEGELESNPFATEIRELLASITAPNTAVAINALDALASADMRGLLPEIAIPTLIINGDLDQICLPQASCYIKEQISGSEQVIFYRSGHAPFLSQPAKFNAELTRFVRSVCDKHTR